MTHRTSPRLLAVVVGVFVGALFGAAPAAAHTTLKQSDPAAGATVAMLPEVVRLTFSDSLPITPTVTVRDSAGTLVNSSPIAPRGNTVLQPVKSNKAGAFTVTWELTAADGHKTTGSFAFTVALAASAARPTGSSNAPSPTAPVVTTATPAPVPPQSPPAATSVAPSSSASVVAVPAGTTKRTESHWPIWTGVTVVLLGAAVTIILVSRRRAATPSA